MRNRRADSGAEQPFAIENTGPGDARAPSWKERDAQLYQD
jgi:hypothetical protein